MDAANASIFSSAAEISAAVFVTVACSLSLLASPVLISFWRSAEASLHQAWYSANAFASVEASASTFLVRDSRSSMALDRGLLFCPSNAAAAAEKVTKKATRFIMLQKMHRNVRGTLSGGT